MQHHHIGKRGIILLPSAILAVALAILIPVSWISYAKFTNSLEAQRTVAAYDSVGARFSSNYLRDGDSADNIGTVYVSTEEQTPAAVVTVCNYEQRKQTHPNTADITYSVSLKLVKYSGGVYSDATAGEVGAYTVEITKGLDTVTLNSSKLSDTSFSGTLEANAANSDTYMVVFKPYQNTIFLEMIVTPQGETDLLPLTGILKASIRLSGVTSAWTGTFQDSTLNTPDSYDGFNYRITGMGSGTATLSWNPAKVILSDVSLRMLLSITGAEQDGSSVTFPVDSDQVNLYDLQFYKVNITTETWSQMNTSVVTFRFS